MEQIINNPGLEDVGENIFMFLSMKDLAKCQVVCRSFHGFLEKPMFWLKKWIQRGLSKKNQKDWIATIDETKDKELMKIVLLYLKKILKKRDFIDVPCFIDKRRRSMRFLQRNQKSLEKRYHQAFEDKDQGSLQILAPLVKNANAPFPSGSSSFPEHFAGWRPTQIAAFWNWPQILKILAPLSDNLNDTNTGVTSMFLAAAKGRTEIVKVLAPLLANPNTPDDENFTPFGIAASNGHLDVVRILAPFVDDINASQNPEGVAPIFYAIWKRQSELVKLLANLSKNLPTPLYGSLTPIGLAELLGADEIVTILKTVEEAN